MRTPDPAIVHFTTVHLRDDSRIRSKMVASLCRQFPGQVALLVQDGSGDERDRDGGYPVIDTGPRMGRLRRMSVGGWRMYRAVLKARPRIAHFHDPELLPWAMLLQLSGIRVIYDVHEDYPEALTQNFRLPRLARALLPPVVRMFEWVASKVLSGIVAATPQIGARFPTERTVVVRNYPVLAEYHEPADRPMRDRPAEFAYVGTITRNRNILGMLEAITQVPDPSALLRIAGGFTVADDEAAARAHTGWARASFDGWVSREGVASILASARAGLVVLLPVPHEMETLPIKLFEYMAAGVPVISSDFPIWREIIEKAECGLLVDPLDPSGIASAMIWILEHPEEAQRMGMNGRRAVVGIHNWDIEFAALRQLYERLLR